METLRLEKCEDIDSFKFQKERNKNVNIILSKQKIKEKLLYKKLEPTHRNQERVLRKNCRSFCQYKKKECMTKWL